MTDESGLGAEKKVTAYLDLFKAHLEHLRGSTQIEWSVTFATWTLLAAISYVAKDPVPHLSSVAGWVFLVPLLHAAWLLLIHKSEDADKALLVSYRRKALDLLGHGDQLAGLDTWTRRPVWQHLLWVVVECGATLALASVAYRVLSTPVSPPIESRSVPRGIPGIELGALPEPGSIGLLEEGDPVTTLARKLGLTPVAGTGSPTAGADEATRVNQALQKRFFTVDRPNPRLPEGVESADVYSTHDVIWQIGLHYSAEYIKAQGWRAVTVPYIGRLGDPTKDDGSSYQWQDARTRLEVHFAGAAVHVWYTDLALQKDLERAEAYIHSNPKK